MSNTPAVKHPTRMVFTSGSMQALAESEPAQPVMYAVWKDVEDLNCEIIRLRGALERSEQGRFAAERRYDEQVAARGKLAEEYGRLNYCATACKEELDQLKGKGGALDQANTRVLAMVQKITSTAQVPTK